MTTGVVKCPMTWVYWTSPKIVAIIDHIPNGIQWLGDVQWGPLMTHGLVSQSKVLSCKRVKKHHGCAHGTSTNTISNCHRHWRLLQVFPELQSTGQTKEHCPLCLAVTRGRSMPTRLMGDSGRINPRLKCQRYLMPWMDSTWLSWVWVKIRYPNNWMVNTKLD